VDIPEFCVRNIGILRIVQVSCPRTQGPEDSPTTMSFSSTGTRTRRTYDNRLREHVMRAGARSLGHGLAIPHSTVSPWKRRGLRPVVTVEVLEQNRQQLLESITRLDRRARVLAAVVRLLLALLRVSEFNLNGRRLPEAACGSPTPNPQRHVSIGERSNSLGGHCSEHSTFKRHFAFTESHHAIR
jgi:hypothetical protein